MALRIECQRIAWGKYDSHEFVSTARPKIKTTDGPSVELVLPVKQYSIGAFKLPKNKSRAKIRIPCSPDAPLQVAFEHAWSDAELKLGTTFLVKDLDIKMAVPTDDGYYEFRSLSYDGANDKVNWEALQIRDALRGRLCNNIIKIFSLKGTSADDPLGEYSILDAFSSYLGKSAVCFPYSKNLKRWKDYRRGYPEKEWLPASNPVEALDVPARSADQAYEATT